MSDLFDIRGGNICLGNAALTGLSGTAKTISYTGNPAFAIAGALYTGDTCSGGALVTTDATTGAAFKALTGTTAATGTGCVFVFGWNAAGEWIVSQGPIVKTADVTNKAAAYEFPSIPDTMVPFAYVTISYVGSTSWLFATGNWDASTVTIGTVINCMLLPDRPLTAASA